MRQFDVCRNASRATGSFPYLLIVQSREFGAAANRLVVPLAPASFGYPQIAPVFVIEGSRQVADPLLMFAIPRERLGQIVCSLADDDSATLIMNAIDRVTSRA